MQLIFNEKIAWLLPELFLLSGILLIFILHSMRRTVIYFFLSGSFLFSILSMLALGGNTQFGDSFALFKVFHLHFVPQFLKCVITAFSLLTSILIFRSKEIDSKEKTEAAATLLASTLGACLLTGSTNLLLIFVGFELISISFVFLVSLKRQSHLASEATMKQMVSASLGSILMVLAILFAYSVSGSFELSEIRTALAHFADTQAWEAKLYLIVLFLLFFGALLHRLSLIPFHFLHLDSISGSVSAVSAHLLLLPFLCGISLALKTMFVLFSAEKTDILWEPTLGFIRWQNVLISVALATMLLGAFGGITQKNIKRLFGYAFLSQIGLGVLALGVASVQGVSALLFMTTALVLSVAGIFLVLQPLLEQEEKCDKDLSLLDGLIWTRPFSAIFLVGFLLSLAGIPPFGGFLGRFYLIGAMLEQKFYWIGIFSCLVWVVGSAHSLAMVTRIFKPFEGSRKLDLQETKLASVLVPLILLIPVLGLGVWGDGLMRHILSAVSKVRLFL